MFKQRYILILLSDLMPCLPDTNLMWLSAFVLRSSGRVDRDSSVGVATCYGLDGSGMECLWGGVTKFSAPVRAGQLSLLHTVYRVSFSGVKRPGRGVDNSPPSSAKVKENADLLFYSPPPGLHGLLK